MKKRIIRFLLLLTPVLIITVVLLFKNNDYGIEYQVKELKIKEKYYSKLKLYKFEISYRNNNYEIAIDSNYVGKELISDIEIATNSNTICIYPKSDELKTYPACTKEDVPITYDMAKMDSFDTFKLGEIPLLNKKFKKIKLESMYNEKILVWGHFGYYYITKDAFDEIKLFKNEVYQDNNSFQIGKYIVVPNYDQKYEFDKFYIINMDTKNIDTLELDDKISFNYYFMGVHDNKGYIFDKKNLKEYEIIPSKNKLEITSNGDYGKVWRDKWEEISLVKLQNNEYKFDEDLNFNYKIEENKLYCKYHKSMKNILISEKVDKIIYHNNETVYFISNGKVYSYSPYIKHRELLEYEEINFNKGLTVYIY